MKKFALLLLTVSWLLQPILPVLAQENTPVTQCTRGVELFFAGDHNAAYPLLEAGFNARNTTTFPDPNDLGICGLVLGLLRKTAGNRDGALEAYQVSLGIFQQTGQQQLGGITLNNIALIYHFQGRYKTALNFFEEALAIAREMGDRAGEGATLNNIAGVYNAQGRYEEALTAFEGALAILQEVGERSGEGAVFNGIAGIYYALGRYEAALITYNEALVILREVGDRVGEGTTLNNIAGIYNAQEQYEAALTAYNEALAIFREVGDRAGEGATLNNIALVYKSQGRYETALTTYGEALVISREVGDRVEEGIISHNIAGIYQSQGQYKEALMVFEGSLAILREVGEPAREGITLYNIGFLYQIQEQNEEAMDYYEEATEVFESIRAVAGSDMARADFIAQYAFLYYRLLDLYVAENMLTEAFLISERGRARSFGDVLATGSVQLSDDEVAPLIQAELSSYNAVTVEQNALIRARALNPPDPVLVANLEVQLKAAQAAHDEALAAIEARGDQLTALVPSRQAVIDLPTAQSLLNKQTTLISFWVLEERTIAFILTADNFAVVTIDVSATDLNTQVQAFQNFPETDSSHPATAIALHNTLITPIQPYLNTPHLIIIPHQALHYVPFAALADGERYLMDEYAITYLPNASMLQFLPEVGTMPTYDTALIVGNPNAVAADDFGNLLPPLPAAEDTAVTVATLFNTAPLLGEDAEGTAISSQVSTANILHLGAHASFNTVAPLQSAIYLTPGEADDVRDDGKLHVDEVYGLPMDNMELVVLSACQTNVGNLQIEGNDVSNITAGDELVSLNRAFLFQSTTVISTLWTVDDVATSLLMEKFYTYLLDGASKADALRLAQMDVRVLYPNPYFWAGFVLSGDAGEINLDLIEVAIPSPNTEETGMSDLTITHQRDDNNGSEGPGSGICPAVILPLMIAALRVNRRKSFYK